MVPAEADPLDALDRAFSRLREIVAEEKPAIPIRYSSLDLRVTSDTPVPVRGDSGRARGGDRRQHGYQQRTEVPDGGAKRPY